MTAPSLLRLVAAAGLCVVAALPSGARAAERGLPAWTQEITLNGFLKTSYSYNFNRPASATNQFRVFDFDDNTFKVDEFELVAQKPMAKPRDAGFRVDFTVGSSVPRVTASAGLFRDATGQAQDIDVHQAMAGYVVPVGAGLRLDLGKFVTSPGYEVIDGYDSWNDNASRSLLFGFAIPFTHVGVRASYPFSSRLSGTAMVVNGWDVARDNNTSKTLGGQLAWTSGGPFGLTVSALTGPERSGDNSDARSVIDVVATLRPPGRLTLAANGDWGTEADAVGPGQDGTWKGIALYARLSLSDRCALTARGEYFEDLDGVRTGVAQKLRELTLTPETRVTPHFGLRGDLRVDHSSQLVFDKPGGPSQTQPTVLFEALYSF